MKATKSESGLLATLGHQRERTLVLFVPVAAYEGMGEMIISYGFDVYDINKLTQFSGAYNFVDFFKIGSISQD